MRKQANLVKEVEELLPERYKFLDDYDSLKLKLKKSWQNFSKDELSWFNKTFIANKNKKREVRFIEAIPILVRKKKNAGFLACLIKKPGLKLAEIGKMMGEFSRTIQLIRKMLEKMELIVIHNEPITEITKCYVNEGVVKSDEFPPIPNIIKIILEMMKEKHGQEEIEKMIEKNDDVQTRANSKYYHKKRRKSTKK